MAIEIDDLPMKHGDFQQLCKRLPEGFLGIKHQFNGNSYWDYHICGEKNTGFAESIICHWTRLQRPVLVECQIDC